jgi:cytochrome c-type protein NapC
MKGVIVLLMLFLFPAVSHAEVDWNAVPVKRVPLFYPGMASWEYLVSQDHATGGNAVARGEKACQDCHVKEGRFDIFADDILKGKLRIKSRNMPFEPEPPKGITGFKDVDVQAAYDATDLYLRIKWPSPEGASFKDPSLDGKGLSDRVAIQLNGNLRSFSKAGCFMSCHNDEAYMPDAPSEDEVAAHPFYAKLKRRDVRLYAYFTRSRGWSNLKPEQEMERYLKAGGFMDLWVAGFKGQEVVASDESIFYDRIKDSSQDISAQGAWQDGFYTVVIKRRLATQDQLDIQMQEGKGFTVGLAVYDNKNGHRKHFVSFPVSVTLGGGQADIRVEKVAEAQAK